MDRNSVCAVCVRVETRSPSSRRAWIEIFSESFHCPNNAVALLAEGVDRNSVCAVCVRVETRSPSSRRAWIEIFSESFHCPNNAVALLAEGVDRNVCFE